MQSEPISIPDLDYASPHVLDVGSHIRDARKMSSDECFAKAASFRRDADRFAASGLTGWAIAYRMISSVYQYEGLEACSRSSR